jgi:glycosyltransferase involved in cell wall biosynthesis
MVPGNFSGNLQAKFTSCSNFISYGKWKNSLMLCPTLKELPPPPPGKKGWPWTEDTPLLPSFIEETSYWPKISIITPSYNQGQFIEETIRSVLLQGYPNLEYIIIDGGSTDDTLDIIRKYEPWIAHWRSEKDRGQSHAINKGWAKATGDILAWLNSDDLYATGSLAHVANFFRNEVSAALIYGDCNIIDGQGIFVKRCPAEEFDLDNLICNKWFIPQQSTFLRRTVVEAVGGLREDLHLVMDWEYWLRIALRKNVIRYLPVQLASFRIWEQAKTSSYSERSALEKFMVLDHHFNKEGVLSEIKGLRNKAYGNVHRFASAACMGNDRSREALVHLLKAIRYRPSLLKEPKILNRLLKTLAILLMGKSLNEKRKDLTTFFSKGSRAKG